MVVINNTLIFFPYIPPSSSFPKSLSDLDSLDPNIENSELIPFSSLNKFKDMAHSEEASLMLMMVMIVLQFIDTRSALEKALKSSSVFSWVYFAAKLGVFMSFVMIPLCELLGGACTCYAYGLDSYRSLCLYSKKQRKTSRDLMLFVYCLGSNVASASGGMKHVFIVLNNFI